MRIKSKNKLLQVASAALVAACLWAPSTPSFAQATGSTASQPSDSALQSQVQSEIRNDSQLSGQQIQVAVQGGQVTLTGSVQNTQQWQQAESVAAGVSGVRTIQNNLTIAGQPADSVTPPPPPPQDEQPDQQQDQGPGPDQQQGQYPQDQGAPPPAQAQAQNQENGSNPPPPPPDAGQQARAPYPGQQPYGGGYGQPAPNQYAQPQSGYPQQPGYQPPYGYQNQPPSQPSGPVAVPAGTLLQVRTSEPLDTAHLKEGQIFQATVASDVFEGNVLTIPRGAVLQGTVVKAKDAGPLGGDARLELRLTSLELGGKSYPLQSDVWSNRGPNKAGYTAGNTVGGAAFGAILGGLIGRGTGAAVGAGVGAAAGLGASAASNGPRLILPPETVLNFHLADPVTVQPVSWQEAQRLASSVPVLQQRPRYYPPPPPYYYAPYRVYYGW